MKTNLLTASFLALLVGCLSAQAGGVDAGRVNVALVQQPRAFVNQPAVKVRLQGTMGLVNTRFLLKNFGTVSTLQTSGGAVVVTGCRPHDCAANGSLVAYDVKRGAFKVWLTVNGKTRVYADKAFAGTLNADAQAYANGMK